MPSDDSIPSFLSVHPAPRPRKRLRSVAQENSLPQAQFLFTEPSPQPAPVSTPPMHAARPPLEPPHPTQPILYTVRELLAEVRAHLDRFYTGLLAVEGEITNLRPAASGHLYFTLKDGEAQISVVIFRRQAQLLGFRLRDGLAVELRGRLAVYESRGQLQLIAETLRPRGEGALQLAFLQLKQKLAAEGLFDPTRKRPLPPFPHCIGIVTSTSGAALRDIIQVTRRRHARLNLLIHPAVVQGPSCPASIAAGIRWFNRNPTRVDLILIARGGGSLEDLAGFNDESLARTIAASALPIVSAIGHEIDTSIADLVADLRAPTPSAAAELITAAQHRIEDRIATLSTRVHRAGTFHLMRLRQRLSRLSAEHVLARLRDSVSLRDQRIEDLRHRLESAANRRDRTLQTRLSSLEARLRRHDPTVRLARAKSRLTTASTCLDQAATRLLTQRRTGLDRLAARLTALSPLAVLNRGYAIVYATPHPTSPILRDASQTHPNQLIRARLAQGTIQARVVIPEE